MWLRNTQRTSLLGDKPGLAWKGHNRDEFDRKFKPQQAALTELAAVARKAKATVDEATAQAHAARKAAR